VRSIYRYCLLVGVLPFLLTSSTLADESPQPHQAIRVAVYDDLGVGRSLKDLVVVLDRSDELEYDRIKATDIRDGKLADYDVLIHPGGSGSKQSKGLEEAGVDQVRAFVEAGGGFVGICAGAYLACNHYSWSLNILDAKVIDTAHWARGHGDVQIRLTEEGKRLFECDDRETILYYQGPLLGPADDDDVPDYTLLATFETEIAKNGAPEGVMKGTTAIASGTFGKGRVLCFSPHPEKTKAVNRFVDAAIRWAAGSER
jgi:glutamine amidotransferase-like uncharacterized protein